MDRRESQRSATVNAYNVGSQCVKFKTKTQLWVADSGDRTNPTPVGLDRSSMPLRTLRTAQVYVGTTSNVTNKEKLNQHTQYLNRLTGR